MLKKQFECLSCGLCCWAPGRQDSFCDVTEEEIKKLGMWGKRNIERFALEELILFGWKSTGAIRTKWLKATQGHYKGCNLLVCRALKGNIMHDVKCKIYEKRPHACRVAIQPGDKSCKQLHKLVNYRPLKQAVSAPDKYR
jgi:Fe-S-cluster containining protein